MNIIKRKVEFRIKPITETDAEDTRVQITPSPKGSPEDRAEVYIKRFTGIAHQHELRLTVVISISRNDNTFRDLKRCYDPLGCKIDTRVDLQSVQPHPVMVDMQVACLKKVIIVPITPVAEMRPPFHQSEFAVHADLLQQRNLGLSVSRAHQESYFRIETLTNF